ncbi:MFS transporter [Amycolatopsis rubida]|uniref:Drug resistance transporter, EmrB/QacA subfamily n=1 Tax=Amycolatopsis rubida TaxID=112413 RepID=A0A1I5GBJ3_9PSEU|nr:MULTISPECIES: MDR family MFS transporter [Amycolatopsis]MYW93935.1 DHA2 family efflux MFS transporter permease subunit [Amycolatopsis rubida]NEC58924.1 MFS transporter [Amycolatopsis rubida]OAP27524.1 Multidrug resistance protein 3 [Amycolatopsis sp. M39]SFO33354.1 drug resistance transporter, EmrB/QacA subfamily [Amycolatopsis rubida]
MSDTATAEGGATTNGRLSHRQILTVLSGLMLGMFLAALDQTIVSSAMKTIADELHGQSLQAWATTAYLITATLSTPLYGKLSDLFGRKPMYLTAISLFLAGSLASAMAGSMYELAAFRAFQGLGAGGLMSLALAIITDITSPRERSRYQGYFMAVFGVSSVAGPVVGGFFAGLDSFAGLTGWRWVFMVNVPIALAALVVVSKVLNLPHTRVDQKVDFLGAGALTVGLVPLLLVAEQGREWGWGSPASLAMYLVGALGVVLFILQERRMGDAALLPLRLFRNGVFRVSTMVTVIQGIGMFGAMMSLPLYLQIVKGATPTQAGLQMLPLTLGIMVASLGSGRIIARTGRYKGFAVAGLGLMAAAVYSFSMIGVDTALGVVMAIAFVLGLGLGSTMQTLTLAATNDVSPRDIGVATSSVTFFRQIGGTAGTAVFLSILFSTVGDRIAAAVRSAMASPAYTAALAQHPEFARQMASGGLDVNDTSFLSTLDPVLARPVLEGFSSSMSTVFLIGGAVLTVGFALVWLLREKPLSDKSAMEQRAEQEASELALAG